MSKNENDPGYAGRAFDTFNEIMANKQKDMLENINRANRGELFVLHFLSMRSTQALPSELSVALNASSARISALLKNLEKKGQIERDINKNNRRNILVSLTSAGRERAEVEMEEMRESMTRVFLEMGEADTEEFLRLTKRFFELSQFHMP